MLKSSTTVLILSTILISCQNNDSKIEELENKIQLQNEAMSKQREADLNETIAEKDSLINNLKSKKKVVDNPSYFVGNAGMFPQGSQRYLYEDDVVYLSSRNLKIMRNEIFARHGYIFKTADMIQHFSNQSWYRPVNNDVNAYLSKIEKENINFIKQYE